MGVIYFVAHWYVVLPYCVIFAKFQVYEGL